jgi:hypothetical protein
MGPKIKSEPIRFNPLKPNFFHPINPWPDPQPPSIQFFKLVLSDSGRFGKSCPPLVLASNGLSPLPIAVARDRTVVFSIKFSVNHHWICICYNLIHDMHHLNHSFMLNKAYMEKYLHGHKYFIILFRRNHIKIYII